MTSFRTTRNNSGILQINLNTLLGDLTLDVDGHSLEEPSLVALERFIRAVRKSQRRTTPSPEPCRPTKVRSGNEPSHGHRARTRKALESPIYRTKVRSLSHDKRPPSRIIRRVSRQVDSPKTLMKRGDPSRNRGRLARNAVRSRDFSLSVSPEPAPVRPRNNRRRSYSSEAESLSPRTRPRRVSRKEPSRTKRTPER